MAKLEVLEWRERNGLNLNRAVRMVKMAQPRCDVCSPTGRGWWTRCPHEPYFGYRKVDDPRMEATEDGKFVKRDDGEVYERVPNINQVAVHERISHGAGIGKALNRGWKPVEDLGFAPMCEFRDCYAPNPPVKTSAGAYCSDRHAKRSLQKQRGDIIEVLDKQKAEKQLQAVVIG